MLVESHWVMEHPEVSGPYSLNLYGDLVTVWRDAYGGYESESAELALERQVLAELVDDPWPIVIITLHRTLERWGDGWIVGLSEADVKALLGLDRTRATVEVTRHQETVSGSTRYEIGSLRARSIRLIQRGEATL